MKRFCVLSSLSLLLLFFMGYGVAHAEVYKWVDDNGQVHYGDEPPTQVQAESIELPKNKDLSDPDLEALRINQKKTTDSLRQSREMREKNRAQAAAERKKRRQACSKLKTRITHVERISQFYKYDDEGKIEYMSDQQGDRLRQNLKNQYQKHCL